MNGNAPESITRSSTTRTQLLAMKMMNIEEWVISAKGYHLTYQEKTLAVIMGG